MLSGVASPSPELIDVVARHVREEDPLLLLGTLADQPFTEPERRREVLALLVAVAGLELQDRLTAVRHTRDRVEHAVSAETSGASSDRIMLDAAIDPGGPATCA